MGAAPAANRPAPSAASAATRDAGKFEVQRRSFRHPPLVQRRQPIRSQALLRQRGQLSRQFLGCLPGLALGHDPIGQADR
uniref:Rmh protein n=1 Tax=Mycobacterium haemophilum TaxID=29311 RepID=Q49559_9MYCO|nr:rmh [Mycobacterium haemophilum]